MSHTPAPSKSAAERYHEGTDYQFAAPELRVGPWTSYSLMHDPKHMGFVLSRYKFCAKMLEGKQSVLEVGCGDGFGLPVVAQDVGTLHAADWDQRLLEGNARRLAHLGNVFYHHCDFNTASLDLQVDGAYTIDVIEHLDPASEGTFLGNLVRCLKPGGVLITGTPNVTASAHATPRSEVQHINLKSMASLRQLMEAYFEQVFMFGMNDEVLHTGYGPMCHYLWSLAVGVRRERQ